MNLKINCYKSWVGISLLIYIMLTILAVIVDFLGGIMFTDTDLVDILANILSSTQGLFNGIFGYGDFFEYSGFHITSFIVGGLLWILIAVILCRATRDKENVSDKLSYLGKILILTGVVIFNFSLISTLIYFIMTREHFSFLIMVFLAVIYIPMLLGGLILNVASNFSKKRSALSRPN